MGPINAIIHTVEQDSLFGVVRCICKDPRKDTTLHSIAASDQHSVCICVHKGFIEY